MRRVGGFLLVALGVALLIAQGVHASERDADGFDALVKGVSARYSAQAKTVPMMWMVSLCARGLTHGGVRGMRVVEFEHFTGNDEGGGFEETVSSKLGEDWSRMIRERQEGGDESLIYVKTTGNQRIDMIVVDLSRGDLNLVKVTMNPDQFARWAKEKGQHGVSGY